MKAMAMIIMGNSFMIRGYAHDVEYVMKLTMTSINIVLIAVRELKMFMR
ncbi:MAG: hypothetical protein Q4G53_09235 [Clostridia bacterium]|nr:hypothetical protein [Clostridia bacterium]